MKTIKHQILPFIAFVLAFVSQTAQAQSELYAETFEYNGVWYEVTVNGVYVIPRPDGQPYSGRIEMANPVPYKGYSFKLVDVIKDSFCRTPNLESVSLPEIENDWMIAFFDSGISKIIFPENKICLAVFYIKNCPNLKEIRFNSRYTELWCSDFRDCKIKIVFEGNSAIYGNPLHNNPDIEWGSGSHRIGDNGLSAFGTGYFSLPEKVILEKYALFGSFRTLEIGKDYAINGPLKDIDTEFVHFDAGVFSYCPYLEKLIVHNPVPRNVHPDAFKNLYYYRRPAAGETYGFDMQAKPQEFDFDDPDVEIDPDQFLKQVTLYVPAEAVETYRAHPQWGQFANIRPITDGVDDITADSDGKDTPQWFNLRGQPVENPRTGQLLLKRTGNRTRKVLLK